MQELFQQGIMKLQKVPNERNPADILTRFIKTEILLEHLHRINMIPSRDDIFAKCAAFVGPHDRPSVLRDEYNHFELNKFHDTCVMICFHVHDTVLRSVHIQSLRVVTHLQPSIQQ